MERNSLQKLSQNLPWVIAGNNSLENNFEPLESNNPAIKFQGESLEIQRWPGLLEAVKISNCRNACEIVCIFEHMT